LTSPSPIGHASAAAAATDGPAAGAVVVVVEPLRTPAGRRPVVLRGPVAGPTGSPWRCVFWPSASVISKNLQR